jgi:hypothetical protein
MDEIIERLEKASGPDREIDGLIWSELDNRDVRWAETHFGKHSMLAKSRTAPHDECVVGALSEGRFMTVGQNPSLPQYTGSIDAARQTVPDGIYWMVGLGKRSEAEPLGGAATFLPGEDDPLTVGEHAQPAIALCIAALRARGGVYRGAPLHLSQNQA